MNKNKKNSFKWRYLLFILCASVLFLGIGYAQIANINLSVTGSATALGQSGIIISDIHYDSCNNMGTDTASIKTYYQNMFSADIGLGSDPNSYITLAVTIQNLTNQKYIFDSYVYDNTNPDFYSNLNIVPNLSGITENSTILNENGTSGDSVSFTITFSYLDKNNISNTDLSAIVSFHFTPVVQITYSGLTNSAGNSSEYIRSESYTTMNNTTYNPSVNLGSYSGGISISNGTTTLVENTDYTYSNGIVTFLNSLTDNYTITAISSGSGGSGVIKDIIKDVTPDANGIYTGTPATGCTNTLAYDGTSDNNLRYIGATPCNYVKFNCDNTGNNCETWRIIGVMNDTGGEYLKIISNTLSAAYNWNDKNNSNDWNAAALNTYLNGTYLSSLNTTYGSDLIQAVNWNMGGNTSTTATIPTFYTDEHSAQTTNALSIGLSSPADLAYATSGGNTARTTCVNGTFSAYNSNCVNNNWMNMSVNNWNIMKSGNNRAYYHTSAGKVTTATVKSTYQYRPCVYLKSTVKITGGDGSSGDPYELG